MSDEALGERLPPFVCEGVVVFARPPSWLTTVLGVFSVAGVLSGLRGVATSDPRLYFLAALLLPVGLGGLFWALRGGPARTIRVDEHGVRVDGHPLAHRRAIARAVVVAHRGHATTARLTLRDGRTIDLRMPDVDGARLVLRTLGLDASRATVTFRALGLSLPHWRRRNWQLLAVIVATQVLVLLTAAGARSHAPGPREAALGALIVLAWLAVLVRFAWPARVTIGGDGVHLRWMGQERFVPIDQVLDVFVVEEDVGFRQMAVMVKLMLKDGEQLDLPTVVRKRTRWQPTDTAYGDAIAIQERIAEVLEERAAGSKLAEARRDLLPARRGSLGAHLATLRRLLQRAASFREDTADRAPALWATVEDASAPLRDRAMAAIALARDPASKRRIGALAEGTAQPRLRAALETAVRDDDEELTTLLRALEGEDERATR
jgi:hypothetical protein